MNALRWITTEAKRLRKRFPHRYKTWRQYVAQASAIYAAKHKGRSPVGHKKKVGRVKRRKKVGAVKGKAKRKRSRVSPAVVEYVNRIKQVRQHHKEEGKALSSLGSVGAHLGHARKILESQIGSLETRKFKATKARTRTRISREIQRKKAQYRKLF